MSQAEKLHKIATERLAVAVSIGTAPEMAGASGSNIGVIPMMKKILLSAAVIAGLGATGGMAREAAHDFSEIDADGDGQVTRAEFDAMAKARFAAADSDGDGFISREEMAQSAESRRADRVARMLERLDADGDGMLNAEELMAWGGDRGTSRVGRHFNRMDANGDDKIAPSEMAGKRDPAAMFARLDSDGNGTLSEDEISKAGHRGMRHRRGH